MESAACLRDGIKNEGRGEIQPAADAMPDEVGIPYTLTRDSIPSPSVLDKNNGSKGAVIFWWAIGDSNPGPTGYEPVALTN